MNWIFPQSKGSGSIPPLNSLQKQRQRQIESLKAAHSNLAEIQKDVEYRLPFTVNNSTITVNILLPPQFPQEKPVVSVFPPVGHHLIDSNNGTMVTSPLITNLLKTSFKVQVFKNHTVIVCMYKPSGMPPYPTQGFHFVPAFPPQDGQRPIGPAPVPHAGVEPQQAPPRPAAPAFGLITDLPLPVPTADSQYGLNGHIYKMPEIPDTFPELSEMSVSQLKDMSDQDDVLLEFFMCLPQLKQVTSDKEELVNNIVEIAKKNLQLEPQLEGKRQEMLCKYEQLTQMKSVFETKMQRQHELSEVDRESQGRTETLPLQKSQRGKAPAMHDGSLPHIRLNAPGLGSIYQQTGELKTSSTSCGLQP
ncbi:hypothetical protein cypCar_00010216 [Cyprinus carpio]|nr:hypothetical protein cypCar_00010216 [Cyprinus carpio]